MSHYCLSVEHNSCWNIKKSPENEQLLWWKRWICWISSLGWPCSASDLVSVFWSSVPVGLVGFSPDQFREIRKRGKRKLQVMSCTGFAELLTTVKPPHFGGFLGHRGSTSHHRFQYYFMCFHGHQWLGWFGGSPILGNLHIPMISLGMLCWRVMWQGREIRSPSPGLCTAVPVQSFPWQCDDCDAVCKSNQIN